jgi:hypothetical protein
MQRFGSQIYTPSKNKQVLALAIYMIITLPKGFCHKAKIIPNCFLP